MESNPSKSSEPDRMSGYARWLWLMGPMLVLSLSYLLQPGEDRRVLLPWGQIALPETCYFYNLFQMNCPGCGLTRSFLHIARGDLTTAFHLNPIGFFLYTYLAFQIPQAALRWPSREKRRTWIGDTTLNRWTRINEWTLIGLMLALVFQWVLRLLLGE